PDDENTRLIAYLENVTHARTAYLSLTRGDGGQNLIGPEIRELLGIIRTQELLAARRIDGGEQFFSRANDFGYSKHPDETFNIWDRDDVLSDVVWTIRRFQPDIIINRFDHGDAGGTHGHHTASAMLSVESFDLTNDPTVYPEQLEYVEPWQPRRIFHNTGWWWYGSREAFEAADKSNMIKVDVGYYLPTDGESISEMAARSRSQHKSQGFGSSGSRGTEWEYLDVVKGDVPATDDPFAGINTTWSRVAGGAPIGEKLNAILADFDFNDPSRHLPLLLEVRRMIQALPDGHWKSIKLADLNQVIQGVMGLFLEAVASEPTTTADQDVHLTIEAINRSGVPVRLLASRVVETDEALLPEEMALLPNEDQRFTHDFNTGQELRETNAYWLNAPASLGMYTVEDQQLRGLPETPRGLHVSFQLSVYDQAKEQWEMMEVTKPVVYKTTDPVKGEIYRPFEITPALFVELDKTTYIYADNEPRTITVTVTAGRDDMTGKLELCHPDDWRVEPTNYDFQLKAKGEEATFAFLLYPSAGQSTGEIVPLARIGDDSYTQKMTLIEYDHIPPQTVIQDASSRVVRINLAKRGNNIGYLMGAGDDIPTALEEIGYSVTLLEDRDFTPERLAEFDAIITGVRAYNTVSRMPIYQPLLLDYVQQGGTLVIQYNTNRGLEVDMSELGPYPLQVSRDRVTVEEAEVRMLAPDHPVLNSPNKITQADFANWVQERGLYFPNEWDEHYTPILSSNDPGEPARDGGLLVAKYGEGYYVYTGYSWFRELPAGVPGAYRLFANLISLGQED
ncbi:MAG: PIG-L family deacetylase, partial [Lewinella sp.]|nr:PIG-L family deacetylase [Lewinella sp.]